MGGILSCCIENRKTQKPEAKLLEMVVIRKPSGSPTGSNGNSDSIFGRCDSNNLDPVHSRNVFSEIQPAQASTSQPVIIQDLANVSDEIQPAQASSSQSEITQDVAGTTGINNEEEALMRAHSIGLQNKSKRHNPNGKPPHVCIASLY